ncbi:MAG: alpha/beta hydrolase [Odoribacter sp.]|nr:alpha/beta hydrolase [Odoribacter sp.]
MTRGWLRNMRLPALFMSAAMAFAASGSTKEVTVVNPADSAVLAGTLAFPSHRPFAAIVMATGSGAQNRDEEVYGLRPFKVISDTLEACGYAVLRLDDRGVGGSTGARPDLTTRIFASDIACAVTLLDSIYPGVPVGVMGHSEGGIIALLNAVENPRCDFIVTLAGPAWSGDSIVMSQSRAAAVGATGRWDNENLQRRLLDIARGDLSSAFAVAQMMAEMAMEIPEVMQLPQVAERMRSQFSAMTSPWYREFLRYDPESDICRVKVPWLALNGEKDTQVLPGNLDTFKDLNENIDVYLLAGHNHMLQRCITGAVSEYAGGGQSPSDEALSVIISWLDRHFRY